MTDKVANPRLIDVFGIDVTQDDVEFAIPRLYEDIPLYVDPFLLWISENPEYRALHARIIGFLRLVSQLIQDGRLEDAARLLAGCEEPRAMGLGYASGSRRGSNIGPKLISSILAVHQAVPQLRDGKIRHIEEMQLVVPGIAEDRISDTASSILRDFFIAYTEEQCITVGIPTRAARLGNVYDPARQLWVPAPEARLPYNPIDDTPILFTPLALLRRLPGSTTTTTTGRRSHRECLSRTSAKSAWRSRLSLSSTPATM
jgi:hypothetical protein